MSKPLKVTTNDGEHGQEEDHDEEQQPDYHEEGSVGPSLRRSAGSFASPPSVSSTAGRPTFIHGADSDLLLRAAQLVVSPQLLLLEELVVSFPGPPVFIHSVADKVCSRKPSFRSGYSRKLLFHPLGCLCVRTGAEGRFLTRGEISTRQLATRLVDILS